MGFSVTRAVRSVTKVVKKAAPILKKAATLTNPTLLIAKGVKKATGISEKDQFVMGATVGAGSVGGAKGSLFGKLLGAFQSQPAAEDATLLYPSMANTGAGVVPSGAAPKKSTSLLSLFFGLFRSA